ncbi:DUF3168 domain-containing protein [Azospirillum sp. sgz302134]
MSATWELQKAVYDALAGALGVPVYDDVPQGAAMPYVAIGDSTIAPASTKTDDGEEHSLTLHVWSQYAGRREVKELLGAIKAALHNRPLPVAGNALVRLRFDFASDFADADEQTRHGVIRFAALTNPA